MRKTFLAITVIASAALAFSSCKEEWEPVLTLKYDQPDLYEAVEMTPTATIADLKQMYIDNGNKPVEIAQDIIIGGQVISSDQSGNIYRELYIQDATGAIDLKVGKSSLYSDYKLGQWVYVNCNGLMVGSYSGMPQLGIEDETGEYETAYIDAQYIIDTHIFRGTIDPLPAPVEVSEQELVAAISEGGFKNKYWGELVTLRGLTYGAKTSYSTDSYKRIFALLYIDPNKDKSALSNRIFLSDKTYGVTTWAMSKSKFISNLEAGKFDSAKTADGRSIDEEIKQSLKDGASAVTLSQYFSLGSTVVQIRTSGYSKFCDSEIDPLILGDISSSYDDGVPIDVTGILTIYNGAAQFTLIDETGVEIQENLIH